MPKIVILPHQDLCPDGAVLEANSGETILDVALRNGIEIEHACEKSCACTTCHCIVREGFDSLPESSEQEDEMLANRISDAFRFYLAGMAVNAVLLLRRGV